MKETSGSLTNTTVTVPADPQREGLIVANNSDTVMTYRPAGTATASIGIPVPAGNSIVIGGGGLIRNAGTLFCAGTSKAYTLYEW